MTGRQLASIVQRLPPSSTINSLVGEYLCSDGDPADDETIIIAHDGSGLRMDPGPEDDVLTLTLTLTLTA